MAKEQGMSENVVRAAALLALVAFAGCGDRPGPAPEPRFECIDGLLHRQWPNGVWVQEDGRNYIGHQDGPMKCAGNGSSSRP